jgi:hypothetical protein
MTTEAEGFDDWVTYMTPTSSSFNWCVGDSSSVSARNINIYSGVPALHSAVIGILTGLTSGGSGGAAKVGVKKAAKAAARIRALVFTIMCLLLNSK